jgi:dolichol-phosphate mannosyltransferase
MRFFVIIPTYNEKENIDLTLNKLLDVFTRIQNHDMNILVTDANSPDGTADIVKNIQPKYPNIHLIVEKAKRGIGAAYSDAMEYAFSKLNADAVITFDADLSHDANIIPDMVKKAEEGLKYVAGSRYKKGGGIPPEWALHRKILSYCGNFFARTLYFHTGLTDFTSGFKLISKEVFDEVKDRFKSGFKVYEIPYKFKDRTLGKSKMTSEYFFNAFKFLIKLRINDFMNSRFGKVFIAGGTGAVSQFIVYYLFHDLIEISDVLSLPISIRIVGFEIFPRYLISQFLSIEFGLTVSFLVNNLWAFSDNRLQGFKLFRGYVKNHFVVSGGILIQLVIGQVLAALFGVEYVILKYIYQGVGILFGLIWNFYFYKKFVWKVK